MTAVVRYLLALLVRSQRWVAPLVLVGFVVGTAVAGRSQVSDAYGFAAAVLVPACAWLARQVASVEPPQSASCTVAAVGRVRRQGAVVLAGLVTALAGALAVTATIAVLAVTGGLPAQRQLGAAAADPGQHAVAAGTGLLAATACALTGLAVGLLVSPPLVRRLGPATFVAGSLCVLALASQTSPAYAALGANGTLPPGAGLTGLLVALGASTVLAVVAAAGSVAGAVLREPS